MPVLCILFVVRSVEDAAAAFQLVFASQAWSKYRKERKRDFSLWQFPWEFKLECLKEGGKVHTCEMNRWMNTKQFEEGGKVYKCEMNK